MARELSPAEKLQEQQRPSSSSQITDTTAVDNEREKRKESAGGQLSSGRESRAPESASNIVKVGDKDQDIYGHLPPHEAAILKRQVDIPTAKGGFKAIYRYSTNYDLLIIFISSICSIAAGAALPLMTVVFGTLAGNFQGLANGELSHDAFESLISTKVLYFIYIGIGEFFTIYISTVGFIYTGEHISGKIREQYLAAVSRHENPASKWKY